MRQGHSSDLGRNDWHRWKGSHHESCSFCIHLSLAHSRQANSTPLAGTGNSDTRHTDKLLFADSAAIAAFLTVEVVINISPISMYRFTAAFADKHYCRILHSVSSGGPSAPRRSRHSGPRSQSSFGHSRFPFQQRYNRISILIVGIMVAIRRRFAVRFGIFSTFD